MAFQGNSSSVFRAMPRKRGGKEDGSGTQKRGPVPSTSDTVGANKKTSTPSTSDRSTETKCIGSVGTGMIERVIHGNRSHIYSRDLQGYSSMVKVFKESHEKDVERLAADRRREAESKEVHALKNAPKHTVLCMKGLISPVWTLGMFHMMMGYEEGAYRLLRTALFIVTDKTRSKERK